MQDSRDWMRGIYFHWESRKQYKRVVHAIPFKDFRPYDQSFPVHCSNWERFSGPIKNSPDFFLTGENLLTPEWLASLKEPLPADVVAQLEQAQSGANRAYDGAAFGYYLHKARTEGYTSALNKELSDAYGLFFSTDVFRAWLLGKEKNQLVLSRIEGHLARPQNLQFRFRGLKIRVARGYFEPPKTSRVQQFIDDLNALGLDAAAFDVNTTAGVPENASKIAREIEAELEKGSRLVLVGASKGSAEIFGALSEVRDSGRPGRGRVEAILSVSGTLGGSFLVDWAIGVPYPAVWWAITDEAKASGIAIGDVYPGLESQSTKFLGHYFRERSHSLPREVPVFDVVGAPTRDTLYRPGFTSELRDGLLDTAWFPRHKANDGLLEYPNMVTPEAWMPENYQIVMDSSHAIFDGSYHGRSMLEVSTRRHVLSAFLHTIADRIEGKF